MLPIRLIVPRIGLRISPISPCASNPAALARLFRNSLQKSLQQRCYAQPAAKPTRVEEELKRQARAAVKSGKKFELPERLVIYHAGTGRTTFLAMVKVTTLFLGAFFCCIMAPSYYKSEKPKWEIASVAICGVIPIFFVAYITAPFVTHIHIHLPPYARTSRPILERFVRTLPASTDLTLTTMSFIAKPRYSNLKAGDLIPARKRFGIINYVRDTTAENARRRWYNYRAVGKFYVQDKGEVRRARYEKKKKDMVDGWIWDAIKEKLGKKAQSGVSSA
ncbi:Fc.00g022560.m01.CDS01 [Cosmosporella sp. VM-42]